MKNETEVGKTSYNAVQEKFRMSNLLIVGNDSVPVSVWYGRCMCSAKCRLGETCCSAPEKVLCCNDDCLEDKREDYWNCSVLYCVQQLCIVICTQQMSSFKFDCWFGFTCSSNLILLFVFLFCCSCVVCFCCVGVYLLLH